MKLVVLYLLLPAIFILGFAGAAVVLPHRPQLAAATPGPTA